MDGRRRRRNLRRRPGCTARSTASCPKWEPCCTAIPWPFPGQTTHTAAVDLPVVDNDQDIARLAHAMEPALRQGLPLGYLIRGHGVYVWGPSMDAALWRLEGLEFLLACELERRSHR